MDQWDDERERNSDSPVEMTIRSRVPSKWRFVDLETGDIWRYDQERGTFTAAELSGLRIVGEPTRLH